MAARSTFGKYTLLRKLATGGMGEVFLAKQRGPSGFEKLLVIKRILSQHHDKNEYLNMFLSEARLVAYLQHSNIIQIHEMGQIDGDYFIAMEYVRGKALRDVIDLLRSSGRYLPLPYVIDLGIKLCDGLGYAHDAKDIRGRPMNIIHRDINPHNVLVSYSGDLKLIDFGIAKSEMTSVHTATGTIKGKFVYMSPEQSAADPLDRRSDIFSLGIVLYEMLTGENPFVRQNVVLSLEAIQRHNVPAPSTRRPDAEAIDAILERALQKRPEDRYQTAVHMRDDLRDLFRTGRVLPAEQDLSVFLHGLFADDIEEEDRLLAEADRATAPDATEVPAESLPEISLGSPIAKPWSDEEVTLHGDEDELAARSRKSSETRGRPLPPPAPVVSVPPPPPDAAALVEVTKSDRPPAPPKAQPTPPKSKPPEVPDSAAALRKPSSNPAAAALSEPVGGIDPFRSGSASVHAKTPPASDPSGLAPPAKLSRRRAVFAGAGVFAFAVLLGFIGMQAVLGINKPGGEPLPPLAEAGTLAAAVVDAGVQKPVEDDLPEGSAPADGEEVPPEPDPVVEVEPSPDPEPRRSDREEVRKKKPTRRDEVDGAPDAGERRRVIRPTEDPLEARISAVLDAGGSPERIRPIRADDIVVDTEPKEEPAPKPEVKPEPKPEPKKDPVKEEPKPPAETAAKAPQEQPGDADKKRVGIVTVSTSVEMSVEHLGKAAGGSPASLILRAEKGEIVLTGGDLGYEVRLDYEVQGDGIAVRVDAKPWAITKHDGLSLGRTPQGPVAAAKRHRFSLMRPGQPTPLVVSLLFNRTAK